MIAALAGGVGASKLLLGLNDILPAGSLTVVANTGDDYQALGLRICPDLDTVMYTLAGESDAGKGWGRAGDSFRCLQSLERYGAEAWF